MILVFWMKMLEGGIRVSRARYVDQGQCHDQNIRLNDVLCFIFFCELVQK